MGVMKDETMVNGDVSLRNFLRLSCTKRHAAGALFLHQKRKASERKRLVRGLADLNSHAASNFGSARDVRFCSKHFKAGNVHARALMARPGIRPLSREMDPPIPTEDPQLPGQKHRGYE